MLTSTQLIIVLCLATGLLAFSAHRLGVLGLALQVVLRTVLVSQTLLRPVLYAQLGLGLAACLILLVSAGSVAHLQRQRRRDAIDPLARMGSLFGIFCVALAGFAAAGLQRAFHLSGLPAEALLTCYWLLLAGMLLAATESSVLGQGLATMTALNGFEVAFLYMDNGLLMTALLGLLEIGLALVIGVLSEHQVQRLNQEEAG